MERLGSVQPNPIGVCGLLTILDEAVDCSPVLVGSACEQGGDVTVKVHPEIKGVTQVLRVDWRDAWRSSRIEQDQPLLLQEHERLPYRNTGNTKVAGKGVLVNRASGRQGSLDDGRPDSVRDLGDDSLTSNRLQLGHSNSGSARRRLRAKRETA